MRTYRAALAVTGLLGWAFFGCGNLRGAESAPPAPPEPVSATITGNLMYAPGDPKAGDTVVIARLTSSATYARKTEGDWITTWFLTKWDVLATERGKWAEKSLVFVFSDRMPTPQSGIMIKRMPIPFEVGRVFAFTLKSDGKPPAIVAMERRSILAPYAKPVPWSGKFGTPEGEAELNRVVKAVSAFCAERSISTTGGMQIVEETPDAYVIEQYPGAGKDAKTHFYKVDRKTYKVELVP
jgi:hypothetical protein